MKCAHCGEFAAGGVCNACHSREMRAIGDGSGAARIRIEEDSAYMAAQLGELRDEVGRRYAPEIRREIERRSWERSEALKSSLTLPPKEGRPPT